MTTNFELTSGRNRALVCYVSHIDAAAFKDTVEAVFNNEQIALDDASDAYFLHADDQQTALNIALSWGETSRRLRVGGSFSDVCVGVFFYNQPAPPEITVEELADAISDDEEPEPPSITSLVCDALRETFGGVYGASAFVIPQTETSFALEVE